MSASIMWRTVKGAESVPHVMAPSAFRRAIETAFGHMPVRIGPGDVDKLSAMAAVAGGEHDDNPYAALIDIIERVDGEIEVWAEY